MLVLSADKVPMDILEHREEKAQGYVTHGCKNQWGAVKGGGAGLCSLVLRTRGCRLTLGKLCVNVRELCCCSSVRMVRQWNRFPTAAVLSPSVEIFKTRLALES